MHSTNHCYFDYRENPKTPNLSPRQDKNGAGSEISLVYLWIYHLMLNISVAGTLAVNYQFHGAGISATGICCYHIGK